MTFQDAVKQLDTLLVKQQKDSKRLEQALLTCAESYFQALLGEAYNPETMSELMSKLKKLGFNNATQFNDYKNNHPTLSTAECVQGFIQQQICTAVNAHLANNNALSVRIDYEAGQDLSTKAVGYAFYDQKGEKREINDSKKAYLMRQSQELGKDYMTNPLTKDLNVDLLISSGGKTPLQFIKAAPSRDIADDAAKEELDTRYQALYKALETEHPDQNQKLEKVVWMLLAEIYGQAGAHTGEASIALLNFLDIGIGLSSGQHKRIDIVATNSGSYLIMLTSQSKFSSDANNLTAHTTWIPTTVYQLDLNKPEDQMLSMQSQSVNVTPPVNVTPQVDVTPERVSLAALRREAMALRDKYIATQPSALNKIRRYINGTASVPEPKDLTVLNALIDVLNSPVPEFEKLAEFYKDIHVLLADSIDFYPEEDVQKLLSHLIEVEEKDPMLAYSKALAHGKLSVNLQKPSPPEEPAASPKPTLGNK